MAKIMVVDDDDVVRYSIASALQLNGHETIEADNGATALEMIKATFPKLIISDVEMANMNGFMLREFLQQDPLTARIPMIIMSGVAYNAGAWESDPLLDYLAKPFSIEQLMEIVNKKLGVSKE